MATSERSKARSTASSIAYTAASTDIASIPSAAASSRWRRKKPLALPFASDVEAGEAEPDAIGVQPRQPPASLSETPSSQTESA